MLNLEDARRYERLKVKFRIASMLLLITYAAVWVVARPDVADAVAQVTAWRWLGLALVGGLFFLGFELLSLPLNYYSDYRLEHTFHLSNQTIGAWLVRCVKEWLVGLVMGGILVGGLYVALWYGGRLWWAWVWIGWMLLSVGLAKLFPVIILPLFYKSEPLERPALHDRFARLTVGTHLTLRGIFRLGLSKDTKKANAMLVGMGATRRVYLSDTLLDAFNDDEIGIVFAHELGHHVHGHILKGIALSALLSTLLVAGVAAVLAPYASSSPSLWPQAVASFPAVALLVSLLSYVLMPLGNLVLRTFERQADTEALNRTKDPAGYRSAFQKLAEMNLADPDPPRWVELLFHDHPALSKRIAMADTWETTAAKSTSSAPAENLDPR